MPGGQESEYLTLGEAAELTGIAPRTLERWAREGRISSEVARDGHIRFRRAELLARTLRGTDQGEEEGNGNDAAVPSC